MFIVSGKCNLGSFLYTSYDRMKFIFMSASDRYIFTKVLLGIRDASVYRGTFNFSDTTFSYLCSLKTMHVSFEYILGLL